jgi:hypothetical protein
MGVQVPPSAPAAIQAAIEADCGFFGGKAASDPVGAGPQRFSQGQGMMGIVFGWKNQEGYLPAM